VQPNAPHPSTVLLANSFDGLDSRPNGLVGMLRFHSYSMDFWYMKHYMWDHPFKSIFYSASPCCNTWQLYHAWQPSSSESLRRSFMSVSDTNSPSTHISCSEVFSFNLLRLLVTKLSWWGFVPKAPRNKHTQKPKQYHPRCVFLLLLGQKMVENNI